MKDEGKRILIYCDDGVSSVFLSDLLELFRSHRSDIPIEFVDAQYLLHESWESNTQLLVIPGGRDLPYVEKLGLDFSQRLQSFLRNNSDVSFFGICAGAYFSASELAFIPFKDSQRDIVVGERMNLVPNSKAVGPLFKNEFSYDSNRGVHILPIVLPDSRLIWSYYNGGCVFESLKPTPSFNTKASFQGKPIIISYALENGNTVILSGVHLEVSHENTNLDLSQEQAAILEASEKYRKEFIKKILDCLGLT